MRQYKSAQVAQASGKAARTIRQLAETHEEIGSRLGRWWVFTDADITRIKAIAKGRPRKRRARPTAAPGPAVQEVAP